ncbi:MAG: aerotolerance regulator BatA [Bacteroidetes bacterium]|nr:MAG: aerotolerance regulator BatA [Bacteroidota bacterium]
MIYYLKSLTFAQPYWFLLFALIPLFIFLYIKRRNKQKPSIQMSSMAWLEHNPVKSLRQKLLFLPFSLRMLAFAFLIIVMARPQSALQRKKVNIEGIDIIMALDVSGSMRAMDLKPNRLEAAKKVAQTFIDGRQNDRIGLVVFSGEAFTQCPLTTDHKVLKDLFKPIKSGMIEDGTAIGDGLATAINRIKDSKAISRVIILLTDGVQNSGSIDPVSAAEIAKSYGIRIYTIGVGSKGTAPMPVQTAYGTQVVNMPVEIDEDILKKVANTTDGKYFRATSNKNLEKVYQEIDQLEKSKIDVDIFQNKYEEFLPFALIALGIFLLEILLRMSIFRTKP